MEKIIAIIKEVMFYVIVIIVILLIRHYLVSLIKVDGNSMKDTLRNKDIMILDKASYRFNKINRFDIVVIKQDKEYLIKRVIGLPSEDIEYKNNQLYINGKKVKENFSHKKTQDFDIEELGYKKIPKDYYFVLGDNRTNSMDSRIIGFIPKKNIIGKATITIYPFNRLGSKK